MERIFVMIEVLEEKTVNIWTFYLTGEADIWWNTVRYKWQGSELTWAMFLDKLRGLCYPITTSGSRKKNLWS